jgi:hypothetical protein
MPLPKSCRSSLFAPVYKRPLKEEEGLLLLALDFGLGFLHLSFTLGFVV